MIAFILALFLTFAPQDAAAQPRNQANVAVDTTFSVILSGGNVYGSHLPPGTVADVGIKGDRIAAIGDLTGARAARRLDVTGMIVAPGFIDSHSHATGSSPSGSAIVQRPLAENYVRQGVTTVMGGQDGSSTLDIGGFLAWLDQEPAALNVGLLIGHGSIRGAVVGQDDRAASPEELARMQALVATAMQDGAFGLSSGLEYTPGYFADAREVAVLAEPAAAAGGLYISHIRDEGGRLLESVREVIDVAAAAGIRAQVTHHKVIGKGRWGRSSESLALVDSARAAGLDVSSDQYPYTASSTGLTILFPAWAKDGGFDALVERLEEPDSRARIRAEVIEHIRVERGADPATIVAAVCSFDPSINGKSLADLLMDRGQPVTVEGAADVAIELVQAGSCSGVFHSMSEEDVERIMQHEMTSISSDGGVPEFGSGVPHPRNYGTFARVLARYVRDRGVLDMETALYKMTQLPAMRYGIQDRGRLATGMKADVAVFRADEVQDTAEFGTPHSFAEGFVHVLVNGQLVLLDGEMTGLRPGKALRMQR